MKMNKIRLSGLALALFLALTPLAGGASAASGVTVAQQNVQMNFDGQALALPTGQFSFAYQSRVYIPLRFASYALQKNVDWNSKTGTVTVSDPTSSQTVVLKEYLMNAAASAKANAGKAVELKSVTVTPISVKLVFDGAEKKLPEGQQAFNLNGTIYVPVRFMSEAIGTTIDWDAKTGSVIGKSKAYLEALANAGSGGGSGTSSGSGEEASSGGENTTGGGSGGSGGATLTVDQVKAATQTKLESLKASCIASISGLVLTATDDADLVAKANVQLASCDASFEAAMTTATAQLKAAGADDADITATIAGYRGTYETTKETYRKLAEQYLGIGI
ncbi:copper amine oxidase N-terminal domain-containing protein [Cohnella fermenti]|uniref:Copper amine oxidase N-terminal domain-containing protein n=1 Tax=Cohnella fermenti TaxID=2565925 RepID=A0A4S4BZS5_9BACL|nr:copper amine oxidase N-terminal domain-containing protein [Cohnella fermenti]THF80828.1 copper amine oxidase N-terminal domain-containing protein [Cohnella fermenti]